MKFKSCGWGDYCSYGWDKGSPELEGACECGMFEVCEDCGGAHIFIGRCEVCGSRRLPSISPTRTSSEPDLDSPDQ